MSVKPTVSFDFDFGFTAINEDELELVQQLQNEKEAAIGEVSGNVEALQVKMYTLYKMILPLLNNLKQNPDKSYIHWPNRVSKIDEFIKKLDKVIGE
jgi:hypothetical protein